MKKQILVIGMFVLTFGTLILNSCKKSDTTPPVITLVGQNPVTVTLGGTYSDAGATAKDDKDGDITKNIVVTVTPGAFSSASVATYIYHYNVSDAAGNAATEVTRTVNVANSVANMAGTYTENENCSISGSNSGTSNVTASSTVNSRIIITNFALNSTATIYGDVSGLNITVPLQSAGSEWYYGSGTISGTTLNISFTDSIALGAVQTCSDTYIKQ